MGIFEKFFVRNTAGSNEQGHFPDVVLHKKKILEILHKTSRPVFLAEKRILLDRYDRLENALKQNWKKYQIAYSLKTNYDIARSRIFQSQGAWAEVVSGYEYVLAKRLGFSGSEIICNGPIKRDNELIAAVQQNALVHIDNQDELLRVMRLGRILKDKARLGLRISTLLPSGKTSRFGFSVPNGEALAAVRLLHSSHIRLKSIHLHIGSDVDSVDSYQKAAKLMALFCNEVERIQKFPVSCIDMGGGFPADGKAPYGYEHWSSKPISDYIQAIAYSLRRYLARPNTKTLVVEPGRYLVDNAVIFITRIYNVNRCNGVIQVLTDGSVTLLPLSYYRPQIVKVYSPLCIRKTGDSLHGIIYGATCQENDMLYEGGLPKDISIGDYVVYYSVGAYNSSMGNRFITGYNKPTIFI